MKRTPPSAPAQRGKKTASGSGREGDQAWAVLLSRTVAQRRQALSGAEEQTPPDKPGEPQKKPRLH